MRPQSSAFPAKVRERFHIANRSIQVVFPAHQGTANDGRGIRSGYLPGCLKGKQYIYCAAGHSHQNVCSMNIATCESWLYPAFLTIYGYYTTRHILRSYQPRIHLCHELHQAFAGISADLCSCFGVFSNREIIVLPGHITLWTSAKLRKVACLMKQRMQGIVSRLCPGPIF